MMCIESDCKRQIGPSIPQNIIEENQESSEKEIQKPEDIIEPNNKINDN